MMMRFALIVLLVAPAAFAMDVNTRRTLGKLARSFRKNMDDDNSAFKDFLRETASAISEAQTDLQISNDKMKDATESIESFDNKAAGLKSRQEDLQADMNKARRNIEDCQNEIVAADRIFAEDKAEYNAKEEDAKVAHGAVQDAQAQIEGLLQTSPMQNFAHKTASTLLQLQAPSDEQKGIDNNYQAQTGGVMAQLKSLEKKFLNQMQNSQDQRKEADHQKNVLTSECNAVVENQKKRLSNLETKKGAARAGESSAESKSASYAQKKQTEEKNAGEANAVIASRTADRKKRNEAYTSKRRADEDGLNILCTQIYEAAGDAARAQLMKDCTEQGPAESTISFIQESESGIDAVSSMLMTGSKSLQQPMLAQLAAEMTVSLARGNPMKKIEDMIFAMINKLKDESLKERTMEDQCDSQIKMNADERKDRKKNTNVQFAEMKEQQAISQKLANMMADTKDKLDDMAFKRKQEKDSFDSLDRKRMQLITSYEQCLETLDTVGDATGAADQLANLVTKVKNDIEDMQSARDNSRSEEDNSIKLYKDMVSDLTTQNDQDNSDKSDADAAANASEQRHATESKAFGEAQEEEARLKAQCVDREESFEERVSRRENTIAMLKDANQMLKSRSQ